MSLITTLTGVITWDGTLTVLMDDTSQIAVGDTIKLNVDAPEFFKITAIPTPNVDVTIENPDGMDIPSDSGAVKDDSGIMSEILEAGDVVKSTPSEELITEPAAPADTKRPLVNEFVSATVHPTKKVQETRTYGDGVGSKSWCRMIAVDFAVVAV